MECMMLDKDTWRETMSLFASGVTVVTSVREDGMPVGSTVSAFSSLSLEPMLLLVCLANRSRTLACVEQQGRFGINILAHQQGPLAFRCASKSADKLSVEDIRIGDYGVPLLQETCTGIECLLEHVYEGGDHKILVGKPLAISSNLQVPPLIYHRGSFLNQAVA